MKNNKLLFIISNIVLVLVVGLILGITFKDHIFSKPAGTAAFVMLIITLCLPCVLYLFKAKLSSALSTGAGLFLSLELIINLVFIIIPSLGIKLFAILQLVALSFILIYCMVVVFFFTDKE